MARLAAAFLSVGLLVLGYLGILFVAQRSLMFPAPRAWTRPPSATAELVRLVLTGGPVETFYLPPRGHHATPAPLLLFTHGNAELAIDWVGLFDEPREWGWGVLLVEYPGYGQSAGKPSEGSLRAAVGAAYHWARHDPRIDSTRIVPYGRSLGGGPASRLAADRPVAGLILESSFTSVRPLARRFLAPGFLVRDPFDNLAALRSYRGPLLVLHGRDDAIIPVAHGRALASAVPGATFHELPCGHNDCPRPWSLIRSFLEAHALMPAYLTRLPGEGS